MLLVQKHALSRALSPSFTIDDAKHILNWYFGNTPIDWSYELKMPVGVIQAIEKLGGIYEPEIGVTRLPNYQPFDEGNNYA